MFSQAFVRACMHASNLKTITDLREVARATMLFFKTSLMEKNLLFQCYITNPLLPSRTL